MKKDHDAKFQEKKNKAKAGFGRAGDEEDEERAFDESEEEEEEEVLSREGRRREEEGVGDMFQEKRDGGEELIKRFV